MNPTSRNVTLLLTLISASISILACSSKDAASENADATPALADGPPHCQRFSTAYAACIAEMPEAARPAAQDGLKQMQDAWKKLDKAQDMDTLCKQALDAARQGVGPVCPSVKWP